MLKKPIDHISALDINQFASQAVLPETAILDYKRDYDLSNSKGKKGFLADICAFANNGGGHILVGIDEARDEKNQKTGLPENPPRGAKAFNKSVAEDVIHSSIDPRLGSFVKIQAIHDKWQDGPVYVIHVQKTWNPPHCVTSSEQRTFYRRSGTKSEPMNLDQIRDSFVESLTLGERIRSFHRERVRSVLSGGTTFFPLEGNHSSKGRTIVHVIPLSFFASGNRLNLDNVPSMKASRKGDTTFALIPNFDGRIAYTGHPAASSYIQMFRHGIVETFDTDLVYEEGDQLGLRAYQIEVNVLKTLVQANTFFESQSDVEPPYSVMFSVMGVKGSCILSPNISFDASQTHNIERDRLELPDVQIDDLTGDVEQLMRPVFDILWQASGWPKSLSYNKSGHYKIPWR